MQDDASNRPRLPSDAGHPQTRGFRTPTLSSHEASLASPHHLHLPVKNLPASNKKPFLERLASFILSNITSINQLKHTTVMASSDSEEVDKDSSLASTEHVFKIWHVWRANFFVFECLCDANHHLQNGRHHPRIGNGPRNHTSSKRRDCSGRRFVASFRRHIFNTTHQFETRLCQSCQFNCTTPHPTRAHLKKSQLSKNCGHQPPIQVPFGVLAFCIGFGSF